MENIVIVLVIILLFFSFRVGGKMIGFEMDFGSAIDVQSAKNTDNPQPQAAKMQIISESAAAGAGTGLMKVGTISIGPGSVSIVRIEK